MSEEKWFWPPGLEKVRQDFNLFYETIFKKSRKRRPLLIQGPRGVGKSAFLDEFEKMYRADHRGAKVQPLNIASLSENLIESELFGHEKGAFTGATNRKIGHIEKVGDGGLLILDEIGEIKPEIQAKLLTLVENGIYYRLGSPEKKNADVQIVCTTHAPEKLRPDFRDRFLSFKIPGLHERRGDVLHYLYYFSPDVIVSIGKNDAFILMAYNWPGNTRQIETYVESLKYEKARREYVDNYPFITAFWQEYPLGTNKLSDVMIIPNESKATPQQNKFNEALKKYGLDLALDHDFGDIAEGKHLLFMGEGDLRKLKPDLIFPHFNNAYEGLKFYCKVTGYDIKANENLIVKKKAPEGSEKKPDIYSMKEEDLLRNYYSNLLEITGGNQKEAARRAGIGYGNFRKRLKKYNIVQ